MYQTLVVAVDGSKLGFLAAEHAGGLARALNAAIVLISVCERPSGYADTDYGWDVPEDAYLVVHDAMSVAAHRVLDAAAGLASLSGLTVLKEVVDARTASEGILSAAQEHRADLIVMGSHGRRGLERLLLGSQAARVLAVSTVPVLVVKDGAQPS